MATYLEWNTALLSYVTSGLPHGSYVFLSIDSMALARAATNFGLQCHDDNWTNDFLRAIRTRCLSNQGIELDKFARPLRLENNPRYLAFLASLVLAAYEMGNAEDEGVYKTSYYVHLARLLDLSAEDNLDEVRSSQVEDLWRDWAAWTSENGFLPSAVAKEGNYYKYIGYAISQTLLRASDRSALQTCFQDFHYRHNLDETTVFAQVNHHKQYIGSGHLRDLLKVEDATSIQRLDALREEVYSEYERWCLGGEAKSFEQRVLNAGLYRFYDYVTDDVTYHVFPRQARHLQMSEITIHYQNNDYQLREERPGWYEPLWEVDVTQLSQGIQVPINDPSGIFQSIQLAARDFWVLVPDPELPDSPTMASWGRVEIGIPFTLLCHEKMQSDLLRLRVEGLITWTGEPISISDDGAWQEYRHIVVIADAWKGIKIEHRELQDALRPALSLSVSVRGGLRVPNLRGWLVGYGPQITVISPDDDITIEVMHVQSEQLWFARSIEPNQELNLEWKIAGDHIIRIKTGRGESQRPVKIVPWELLSAAQLNIPNESLQQPWVWGALVPPSSEVD